MHIIAGKYKGFGLDFPKIRTFRPTQSRVKESLFNILRPRMEGARFLELCAGTGAIGFEAFSQGASQVVMVELSSEFLKKNHREFLKRFPDVDLADLSVISRDACLFLKSYTGPQFDIIFMDPPWDLPQVYADLLNLIIEFGILSPEGIVVCEYSKKSGPVLGPDYRLKATYTYGGSILSLIEPVKK